jgi:hypothetical protein
MKHIPTAQRQIYASQLAKLCFKGQLQPLLGPELNSCCACALLPHALLSFTFGLWQPSLSSGFRLGEGGELAFLSFSHAGGAAEGSE